MFISSWIERSRSEFKKSQAHTTISEEKKRSPQRMIWGYARYAFNKVGHNAFGRKKNDLGKHKI